MKTRLRAQMGGLEFRAEIDRLPPSSNKIKTPVKSRMILTTAARRYRSYCYEELKRFDPPVFRRYDALRLKVVFRMPNLENKGWQQGKTKYRYKRRDTTNMIKLLEDVVALYLEIDDSQFLIVEAEKQQANREGVQICVTRLMV